MTSLDPRLPALMRSIFQTQREVAHLYAGSKREMMHNLFSDKNEPFFRSAKIMEIGAISSRSSRTTSKGSSTAPTAA